MSLVYDLIAINVMMLMLCIQVYFYKKTIQIKGGNKKWHSKM